MTFNAGIEAAALLPCPFCGGEAVIEQKGSTRQSNIVACTECGCRLESGDVFDPAGLWNTRPSSPSDPAQEPQAVAPVGYLFAKAGENNGYYFVGPSEIANVEDRFHHLYTPVYTRPALDREAIIHIINEKVEIGGISDDWERPYLEGVEDVADALLALIEGRT